MTNQKGGGLGGVMHLFGSEEWLKEVTVRIDEEFPKQQCGRDASVIIQFSIGSHDNPNPISFWFNIEKGKVKEFGTGENEKWNARVEGDPDIWKQIVDRNLDPLEAIMSKELLLEGDMQNIIKNARGLSCLIEIIAEVPTQFGANFK